MNNKRRIFFENLKTKILSGCSDCDHTGWLDVSDSPSPCRCLKQFERYLELDAAGIDKEYWDLSLASNWNGDQIAKDRVEEYITNLSSAYDNGLGIVFHGTNGVGKTFLGVTILKKALELGKSVCFITMAELCQKMKSKIDSEGDREFYEDRVKNVDYLYIDNLGSEYRPQNFGTYTLAEFDILARHRRRNLLPTLLSTNLSREEFISQYGSSISSLFSASAQFLHVQGSDFRQSQGQQYFEKLRDPV